jgi:nucleotide-binding universal stress UspA family protein
MAKRILVPLDQSQLAESVVPLLADAARGGEATIRLLHVGPVPESLVDAEGRVLAYADQEMDRLEAAALDYLRMIALQFVNTPVECVVRFGDAVRQILDEADSFGADLIAVSTAGRSGLSRALFGSVAEQVFRKAEAPVLLLKPGRPV